MITFKEFLEEMTSIRYAVVDQNNNAHYITDDEKAANRVAKKKDMVVHHIFAPKLKNLRNAIKIKSIKENILDEGQREMTNMMDAIHPLKRKAVRKVYDKMRANGQSHASAMTYSYFLFKESVQQS